MKSLLRDRDTKYVAGFDEVFRSEGADIVRTPSRTPNANAHAERIVRTVRTECLDHLLIVNARHLERVLRSYVRHYNDHRPHQGIDQEIPDGPRSTSPLVTLSDQGRPHPCPASSPTPSPSSRPARWAHR